MHLLMLDLDIDWKEEKMDYLAKVIVDLVSLAQQLFVVWANGGNNVPAQDKAILGDSITSVFANSVNFLAELTAEIMRQMSNIAS